MSKKRYIITWIISFLALYLIAMSVYIGYCIEYRGLEVIFPKKIQDNYAKYLIKNNDDFVDKMMEFEYMLSDYKREFSKEEMDAISKNIEEKNDIMIKLQQNPPDYTNKDYSEIYKDILKVYAFYIQGEIMRVEYISNYKDSYTLEEIKDGKDAKEETYTMGMQLCNMMGSLVVENPNIINKIKNTDVETRYPTKPMDEWMDKFEEALNKSKEIQDSVEENKSEASWNKDK